MKFVVDRAIDCMRQAGLNPKYVLGNGCTQSRAGEMVERLERHYDVQSRILGGMDRAPLGERLARIERMQAAALGFEEDHSTGNDRTKRSIKHSYRAESRNFVE